jgi:HAD superfamily hydrolase (TIGR01509 family)
MTSSADDSIPDRSPHKPGSVNGGALRRPTEDLAYRAGVPEQAEPPSPRQPAPPPGAPGDLPTSNGVVHARPIQAVLFDFQGTLAQVEEPISWVRAAAAACDATLDTISATVLADRLVTVGRAGGPPPVRIPPHLIEVWAERDLYAYAHRAAFTGLAATVAGHVDGLPEALYERLSSPAGWLPYSDAIATVTALRAAGVRTAVVSNIGFDIRPLLAAMGMGDLFDAHVLSFEVGRVKPDPAIFRAACAAVDAEPEFTLMVGDTPADAAAVGIGCAAYVVPAAGPGAANGLGAVAALVQALAQQRRA